MSNLPSTLFATVETAANAIARKGDAFADMFLGLYAYVVGANEPVATSIARDYYVAVRNRAEAIALAAHKPLKPQDAKSLKSQVAKFNNAYLLATEARKRSDTDITEALDAAARKCQSGYTKLVKCAVAVKAVLAANPLAPLADMIAAIDGALVEERKPASEMVARMAASWDKLVHGSDEEPSEYQPEFAALLRAYPADYAETIANNFAAIVKIFERAESEAAERVALAKAK